MANVKCADCGYVALRSYVTRQLIEVDEACRRNGTNPVADAIPLYCGSPICAVMAFDLAKEDPDGTSEDWVAIFERERPCEKFVTWQRGLTPKEHVEMMQQMALLEWQRNRDESDRKWREMQEEKAEARHKESLQATSRTTLIAACIGFVGGLAAAAFAYLLPNWPAR